MVMNRKEGIKREIDTAPAIGASDYRGLNRNQDQPIVLHNIYGGFNEKEPRVSTDECPNITSTQGSSKPVIIDKRLNPKNKDIASSLCGGAHSGGNHSDMDLLQEPRIVASRGRNPNNPSDCTTGSPTEQRLEPNSEGTTNSLTNVQKDNWVSQNQSIRRLTPTECERLQGFPDGWTQDGLTKDGGLVDISDTQRYKCLGNAVTTNVITAAGRRWRTCEVESDIEL